MYWPVRLRYKQRLNTPYDPSLGFCGPNMCSHFKTFLRHKKIHESRLTIHSEFRTSAQTHNIRVSDILYTLSFCLIRDEIQIGGGRFRGRSFVSRWRHFHAPPFSLYCAEVCYLWEMTLPRCRSTRETPNGLWRAHSFSHFTALYLLLLIYNQANH